MAGLSKAQVAWIERVRVDYFTHNLITRTGVLQSPVPADPTLCLVWGHDGKLYIVAAADLIKIGG